MKKIIFIFLIGLTFNASAENKLNTFMTDGCTLFIDGPPSKPSLWRHCCIEHDIRYWFGGDQNDLNKADLRLRECVQEVAGKNWADIIYAGVRVGHKSPIVHKTHWSWGWATKRGKIPLEADEIDYVINEVRNLPYDPDFLNKFIERNFYTTYE